MTERNRQSTYMGYAFESYCTSAEADPLKDAARQNNGWSGDVDTNVQWCSVVKTKLADTRIIIGGEVDCVRGVSDIQFQTHRSCILTSATDHYSGNTEAFVELKTSLLIRHSQDEARFEKFV